MELDKDQISRIRLTYFSSFDSAFEEMLEQVDTWEPVNRRHILDAKLEQALQKAFSNYRKAERGKGTRFVEACAKLLEGAGRIGGKN